VKVTDLKTEYLDRPFGIVILNPRFYWNTSGGLQQTAYRIAVKCGDEMIWKNWDGEASSNHYSAGSVCERLLDTVAGILVASENRFVVAPTVGGTLTYNKAEHKSIYGIVKSAWQKVNGDFAFHIEIPANTTAQVVLPNGAQYDIVSGVHEFIVKSEEENK